MKLTTRLLSGLILFAGLSAASLADDTDIYLDPLTPTGSEPLVMFTLDYRANMNATQCNVTNTVASIEGTCGFSNSFSTTLFNDGSGVDGKITLYEVIRAALGEVLDGVSDVKVGLMMPHENTTAGGGCDPTDTECSNGAMVMMGFSALEAGDANGNKQKFKDILKSIPATGITGLPDFHPYQLKEMYFELFRYLIGGKIVNAHQGWQDFDDSNAAKSVNLDAGEPMAGEHAFEAGILTNGFKTVLSTGKTFANGSTTTTLELAPSEPSSADYAGKLITVNGETTLITAYNGAQDRATVSPALSAAPLNTDGYVVTQINYPQWDASIEDSATGKYISPLTGNDCTKVFAINIGFGTANGDNDLDSYISQATAPDGGLGMGFTSLGGSNTQAQVVQFMKDVDLAVGNFNVDPDPIDGTQNVTSYFVMQSANNTQHAWAAAGGTGNAIDLGSDPDVIVDTITNIFKSILAVSTTFVAPSVPVNVFNRAQTVNEVFLALFEADETGLPIWNGNLKKVLIGTNASTGNLELQDANGVQAIDIDGRLRRDALTFYTDGTTLPAPASDEVANKDGRAIARGGVGQQMPGIVTGNPGDQNSDLNARKLYTENPGDSFATYTPDVTADGLTPLDAVADIATEFWQQVGIDSGISAAPTYAAATTAEKAEALNALAHARGLLPIVDATLTATAGAPAPRAWMLGDPLHSRPRPINYGARGSYSTDNPDIRIVIGTNDGFLHMFKNTVTGTPDTSPPDPVPGLNVQDGSETWAFMPQAAMKTLNRWQENVAGEPKHPNTTDGSPVVLVKDGNLDGTIDNAFAKNPLCVGVAPTDTNCDQVIIFFGMRRGGDNIYAIDATDPDNPKFLWRILGGSGDFLELTQTWSQPSLGRVRLETSTNVFENFDVLVFGGGYNGDDAGTNSFDLCDADDNGALAGAELTCKDSVGKDLANRITRHNKAGNLSPAVVVTSEGLGIDDPEGNAIFMVNAQTGALIWKATIDKIDATSTTFDSTTNTLGVPLMKDSIPGEITAVDTTGTGFLDRIYAADTGGNVWRFDLGGLVDKNPVDGTPETLEFTDKSVWTAVKLFQAGRHFNPAVADDRRFFNRVDVAQTRDDVGAFDGVLLGSGDREDPLGTARSDWFYLVKDRNINSGYPPSSTVDHDGLADLSNNCLQTDTLANCGIDQNKFNAGWRISLSSSSGEKNLAASVTSGGNVFFTTFAPEPVSSSCGLSEGIGRFYALSLQDATGIFNFDSTNDSGGTTYERSDTLGSGGIPVEVVPLGGGMILVQGQEVGENIVATGGKTGFKTYWYEMPTF